MWKPLLVQQTEPHAVSYHDLKEDAASSSEVNLQEQERLLSEDTSCH